MTDFPSRYAISGRITEYSERAVEIRDASVKFVTRRRYQL